jgi:diguanylate cyclase (GGDEF)-like protein
MMLSMNTTPVLAQIEAADRDEIETILALARALASMTTLAALRDGLNGPLRPLLPSRDISVLRAAHGAWEAVVGPEDGSERITEYAWTSLVADGKTIGMLGIGAPAAGGPAGRTAEVATAILATTAQNVIALDNLRHDSVRDSLTGCFTRAHGLDVLEGNLRRANRTGFPLSVMMIDIDDFKRINDRYGHVPGDAVLSAVAGQLHGMLRRSDVRCRLGGDEFLVILPETPLEDAIRVAESVRHAIEEIEVSSARGKVKMTASIGVATAACGAAVDVAGFIDRADVALYRAKQAGRNCVQACVSSSVRMRQSKLRLASAKLAESRGSEVAEARRKAHTEVRRPRRNRNHEEISDPRCALRISV